MADPKSTTPSLLMQPSPDRGKSSQESSPVRTNRHLSNGLHQGNARTANSDGSPTRPTPNPSSSAPTVPSAAAVQRALSAQRPASCLDGVLDGSRDRYQRSGTNSPSWPTSPRLKSPPPTTLRNSAIRKGDGEQAQSNTARRLATVSAPEMAAAMLIPDIAKEQPHSSSHLRVPARGVSAQGTGLETVAESSVPTTPSIGPRANPMDGSKVDVAPFEQRSEPPSEAASIKESDSHSNDSVSKPKVIKSEGGQRSRAPSTSRPITTSLAKRSFTSLTGAKSKPVEPMRTLTVETESVTVPQLPGDRNREGGSVRTKPSTETIRPKKEKKRTSRKTPSLHAGTVTSKADIFEAKVASAVNDADTSDSDETFVYESNPPEPRSTRHHSRTPSATSLTSQNDHYGGRNKHGVRSGSSAIPGKKSMKFSNSSFHNHLDSDNANGSQHSTRATSSTPRHHHIGRYGRNGHPSLFDSDSPFTQASKPGSPRTSAANVARQSQSRPNSPRFANGRFPASPRKQAGIGYDAYEDAADDERAPLIGSVRINRSRHSRRPNSATFRSMDYPEDPEPGCRSRVGSCMMLGLLIALVCIGVATFIVALSRPLLDVEIKHIQNVLASEQELMLDLHVKAVNSNLFVISVGDLDVNLFAESPYVGTADDWMDARPSTRPSSRWRRSQIISPHRRLAFPFPPFYPNDGIDEGTDPTDEPEPGTQKMLLGRILEFDSPLVFDAAPIRRTPVSSVGEIRLAKPGNKTEVGGSVRWERVLQHPFDLIVRGVIKYQLPLSSKTRSAKIGGRIRVSPEGDGSDGDAPSLQLG